jgi:hypothetical protein
MQAISHLPFLLSGIGGRWEPPRAGNSLVPSTDANWGLAACLA